MSLVKTNSDTYEIENTNSIERITQDKKAVFNKLWIYPGLPDPANPGKLAANSGTVYVGEDAGLLMTPDPLGKSDPPIEIKLPSGQTKRLYEVLVQGAEGDGVYFKYW